MAFEVYENKMEDLRRRYQGELQSLRDHRNLVEWADRLANLWSLNRDWYATKKDSRGRAVQVSHASGAWWGGTQMKLWLGQHDSMALESLGRIFDKAVFNDFFEDDVACRDARDSSYREWTFKARKGGPMDPNHTGCVRFVLTAHVKDSEECQVVGTGKFVEETRIVCGAA